jgi:hypothetical protein
MTRDEKLDRILARIEELLDLDSRRTQGEWIVAGGYHLMVGDGPNPPQLCTFVKGDDWEEEWQANKDLITLCSVNFKALCLSTKAAIEGARKECEQFHFPDEDRPASSDALDRIVAAWEGLL